MFITTFIISFILTFQTNWENVQIKSEKLSDRFHIIYGSGGNIGLYSGAEYHFVIDSQFEQLAERLLNKIDTIFNQPIRYMLNTHYHGDHSGSNRLFLQKKITVIAHENVRTRMGLNFTNDVFKTEMKKRDETAYPIITFNDEMRFYIDQEEVLIKHLKNGHTDGDAIVFFKRANIIHCGDLLFSNAYPYIDISAGGSLRQYLKNQEFLAELGNEKTLYVAGHGRPLSQIRLKEYTAMLNRYFKSIEQAFKAGKNLDEIRVLKITKESDDEFGKGFINADTFLLIAYMTLEREN